MPAPLFPNFFIIGAPKSGTTALSEYLRLHPRVFFCDPKEPEYFATDFQTRLISRESDYLRLFQLVDPLRDLAVGEGSTIYLFSHEAVPNILKFRPHAKLIAMLRNPAELVVSFYSHLLADGNEIIPSFSEAWEAEAERRVGKRIPPGTRNRQLLYYSDWGRLGTQIQRVMQIAPKEQLKLILYDDFAREPRRIYLETLEFLGLPDDGRNEFPVVNERRQPNNLRFQKWIGLLTKWWLPVRVRLTGGRGLGLGNLLRRFSTRPSIAKQLPSETRQRLAVYYHDEIRLMEQLLERDLSHWL